MGVARADETEGQQPFAFFVLDVDHKWRHEATCYDQEIGIGLVEKFKHDRGCLGMVVLRIPDGHKIYEWGLRPWGEEKS